MPEIEVPQSEQKTIYDFGFDKSINRNLPQNATGVVYDAISEALNTGQMLSGGNLTLKSLSIGGLVKQVAPGDNIQEAIDAISREGGGIVQFLAGKYNIISSIEVKSNVSIVGAGKNVTILDFGGRIVGITCKGKSKTFLGTNVTFTEGSTAVTGTLTTFTNLSVGDILYMYDNNFAYTTKISSITDDTSLTIEKAWPIPTVTTSSVVAFTAVENVSLRDFSIINGAITSYSIDIQRAVNISTSGVSANSNSIGGGINFNTVINCINLNTEGSFNGTDGFNIIDCKNLAFYNCESNGNGSSGFEIDSTISYTSFYNCHSTGNTGSGFSITGKSFLIDCIAAGNDGDGFDLNQGDRTTLINCFANDNGSDGIDLSSITDNVTIINCHMHNNDAYGILIVSGATYTRIINPFFSQNATGDISDSSTTTNIVSATSDIFAASNGANNNVALNYAEFVRITGPSAAFSISGVTKGVNGRRVVLYNSTTQDMTITNEGASSSAENRILTLTGADIVLTGVSSITLIYSQADSRWIVSGQSG